MLPNTITLKDCREYRNDVYRVVHVDVVHVDVLHVDVVHVDVVHVDVVYGAL